MTGVCRDERAWRAPGPFRRVLVRWDATPDSLACLRAAAALVGDSGGHVVALSVLPGDAPGAQDRDDEDRAQPPAERIREAFERARADLTATWPARLSLETTASRHVTRSICEYAAGHGFDLLVIGRHRDGGMLHPRLGHVADAAVRASTVPCCCSARSKRRTDRCDLS